MKHFENIDIKNLITIVALVLWVGYTAYGFYIGKFDDLFDYFKQIFLSVVSFYLGSKVGKAQVDAEPTTDNYE